MALFQLLFGRNKRKGFQDQQGDFILELDCVMSESLELTAAVTRSEIESGAQISDHVAKQPEKFTIEGLVSGTPAKIGQAQLASLGLGDPVKDAMELLRLLYETAEPFDFVGGLEVYTNMVITTLAVPRSKDIGQALRFTAVMEKLKIVDSAVVPAVNFKGDVAATAAKKQSLGTQPTTPAVTVSGAPQNVEPTAGTGSVPTTGDTAFIDDLEDTMNALVSEPAVLQVAR